MKPVINLILILLLSPLALAQQGRNSFVDIASHPYSENIRLKQFSVEQGLEASYIYDIVQDSLNRLWLGTNLGVFLYDDHTFTQPRNKDMRIGEVSALSFHAGKLFFVRDLNQIVAFDGVRSETIPLPDSFKGRINCLQKTKDGRLLAGTSKGILQLLNGTKAFTRYPAGKVDSLFVFSLSEDKSGEIAIGTNDGLWFLKRNVSHRSGHETLGQSRVTAVLYDKNRYLWCGTIGNGLFAMMGTVTRHFQPKDGMSHPSIISLEQDSKGDIYAGTFFGYNHLPAPLYKPSAYRPGEGIDGSSIWCIKRDNQNNLWIGSENGLFTHSPSPFTAISDKNGLVNSFVISAHKDPTGAIWFGTQHGLSRLENDTFYNYHIQQDGEFLKYYSLASDSSGNIYLGTHGLGVLKGKQFRYYGSSDGFTNAMVSTMLPVDSGLLVGTRTDGMFLFKNGSFKKQKTPGKKISYIIHDKFNRLVIATEEGIFFKTGNKYQKVAGSENHSVNVLFQATSGELYVGTVNGALVLDPVKMKATGYLSAMENESVTSMLEAGGFIWAGTTRQIWKLNPKTLDLDFYGLKHGYKGGGVPGNAGVVDDKGNIYWGSMRHLSKYDPKILNFNNELTRPYLESFQVFNESINWAETHADSLPWDGISFDGNMPWLEVPRELKLPYFVDQLTFKFNAVSFKEGYHPEVRYQLAGYDTNWINAPETKEITYLNLEPGAYTFILESRVPGKKWKASTPFAFEIVPAFWQTKGFEGLMLLVSIGGLVLGVRWRFRSLSEKKGQLEKLVRKRTLELSLEKAEVEKKSLVLEEKNEEIFKSIRYAKRIQEAIIPSEKIFAASFRDAFVLFQPKDIVSGDFYWTEKLATNDLLFAVADCTGHGVPGAFMSIVGYNGLNKAINESRLSTPGRILDSLNLTVSQTVRHAAEDDAVRDGMDAAICRLRNYHDFEEGVTPELEYAGANIPLWIIRADSLPAPKDSVVREGLNGFTLYEIRPTKQAIGGPAYLTQKPFVNHIIPLIPEDIIYLFTDGYPDAFGGPANKKFKKKNLGKTLLRNHALGMAEQKDLLQSVLKAWVGPVEQIDDICIAGIRI